MALRGEHSGSIEETGPYWPYKSLGDLAMFKKSAVVFALALCVVPSAPQPAEAQSRFASMSCGQLWYQRNAIYARAGYCFKTAQAIGAFGKGCFPPYGELSSRSQSVVDEIQYWEGRKGCN